MRNSRLGARRITERRRNIVNDSDVKSRRHRPDYFILVLMGALLICGAVVVYAIGPGLTGGTELSENYYSSKQIVAIILGIIGFIISSSIPLDKWKKLQPVIVALAMLSAIIVRVAGEEVNGVHRWIQVGGFSFQPAELIKLALVLWLASFLSEARAKGSLDSADTFKKLGIVTISIVLIVAGLQSDLGSAAVMMAVIGVVSFVAGLPLKKLGIVVVALLIVTVLAISTSSYRRDRIATFINPSADCQNEGYQACQALITVGSGGVFGKGLGKSVQAYGYLPEPANDSIFAIVAEKFGFAGTLIVIGVFWALFSRISLIAKASTTDYNKLLVSGILVWFSAQTIINIGAMIGLLPLKGITLPFVSYGGTSIIFVMIAMGIVFQASRYTDLLSSSRGSNKSSNTNTGYLSSSSRYKRRSL